MKLHRLLGLATVASVAGMLTVTPIAGASTSITGAGSTLIAPLMANWATGIANLDNINVTYGSVGSGTGIAQITARTVDFGASDAPLTANQATACNGCVQIPWALTAVAPAINIPGVRALKLSGPVLAQIYLGQITTWNDSRIAKLNKGVSLPALTITPVFRSDGSGDTYAFTDYLSRVNKTWKSQIGGASTVVTFPKGVGGKGNAGVTAQVQAISGSIGYLSASYVIAHGLNAAALQNAAGKFVYANLSNISAAAASIKSVPASNELHIVNPSAKYPKAYPLSTFTYVIVPHNATNKAPLSTFIKYALTTGQQYGAALDFAPVPKVVIKAANKALATL